MSRVPASRRAGVLRTAALAVLAVVVVGPLVAGSLLPQWGSSPQGQPLMCRAVRQEFVLEVSAKGEVESALNVEVRCEVRPSNRSWLRILEVVPEGTRVEPGDLLVRLDSADLETDRDAQRIGCEQAKAALALAESKYEVAKSAKDAYLEGEYRLARTEAQNGLELAEHKQRRARQYLESSRTLLTLGHITPLQFQADQFALTAAETDVQTARLKLDLLENYTKPKMLKELQSTLVNWEARLAVREFEYRKSVEELARLEEEIKKCVIRAPAAGKVVLAHLHHNDHSHMVEPGELTHTRRVLVRLPNPRHMQVKAKIDEDKIALVRKGLPVTIRFEAFPEVELPGEVVRVSEYPEPDDWMGSGVKQYLTTVRIDGELEDLRPRLTADLAICVQRLGDQLQLPSQAVVKHGEKTYCLRIEGRRWEAQEISVGANNGKYVLVRSGLEEGQEVILAAEAHRAKVVLPELPAEARPRAPLAYK